MSTRAVVVPLSVTRGIVTPRAATRGVVVARAATRAFVVSLTRPSTALADWLLASDGSALMTSAGAAMEVD